MLEQLMGFFEGMPPWLSKLMSSALTVVVVIFAAILVIAAVRHIIKRAVSRSKNRRADTLYPLLRTVLTGVVVFWAASDILDRVFGVAASALLATAGVLGIAVGFGAQSLVKDVISGFFILLDDQYAAGERVTLSGFTGVVEELGLRSTKLRNDDGDVFFIQNGSVTNVVNHSRNQGGQ